MVSKTIKGSIVLDFCVKNLVEGKDSKENFPDEDILDVKLGAWTMCFDGAMNRYENRIGVLLINPKGSHIPLAVKL